MRFSKDLILSFCCCFQSTTIVADAIESFGGTTPMVTGANCEQWQRFCENKTFCTERNPMGSKCFNCVKFPTFGTAGSGAKPTKVATCDASEVYNLQSLQNYRCDPVYTSAPCGRSFQTYACQWKCIKRPDKNANTLGINLNNYDTQQ